MSFYTNVQLVGDDLLYLGYEEGPGGLLERIQRRMKFSPTLFVCTDKKTKFKTLDGRYAKPVKFESVREARGFVDKYRDVEGFDVHGYDRYLYQFISEEFPQEVDYDLKTLKITSLDIEVACENGFPNVRECAEPLLSITVQDYAKLVALRYGARNRTITPARTWSIFYATVRNIYYVSFLHYWGTSFPDVLTGWNVELYDIPYICGRLERLFGSKEMKQFSPWGIVHREEMEIKGRTQILYNVFGVSVLDYLDLYKKFTYTNQESYRLDHIAFVELWREQTRPQ